MRLEPTRINGIVVLIIVRGGGIRGCRTARGKGERKLAEKYSKVDQDDDDYGVFIFT